MIRSLVKNAAAHAVCWTRLDAVIQANRYRHVPFVVAYHRVVPQLNAYEGFALPAMEISVAMLGRHLDWLGRRFRIVSLDDLGAELDRPRDSKPLAAVTFDDGYNDVFHHGFPLLKRKGIPAGIFVVTDLVGTTELPVHERLHALLAEAWLRWKSPRKDLTDVLRIAAVGFSSRERLPEAVRDPFSATRYLLTQLAHAKVQLIIDSLNMNARTSRIRPLALQPLSWEMLATMRDAGMKIGSHSKTHAFLTNESTDRVREEAEVSRRHLQQKLGVEIRCFAYPGGTFNSDVVQAVEAAGYRYAFTTCRHRDRQRPLLTIPRTMMWEPSCRDRAGRFSQAMMSCQAAGAFDWASSCRAAHPPSFG